MNTTYIMRGISGSGKSTLARDLAGHNGIVHSTDDYFIVDGVYRFNPKLISSYHERNLLAFKESLRKGIPTVICDNTNSCKWEMQPYIEAAEQRGYRVAIVFLPHPGAEVAAARSTHFVPLEVIKKMLSRWEY